MKKFLLIIASLFFTASLQAQSFNLPTPAGSVSFGYFIKVLSNGNYVVIDPSWNDGLLTNVGAVYLYNGQTNGLISTLRGSHSGDQVGYGLITPLSNGNFIVLSPYWKNGIINFAGAATWVNGTTGLNGIVTTANSLVGDKVNDEVGYGGVTELANHNFVVRSPNWGNGNATFAGAVTWGNGESGVSGVVSSGNSLVGSQTGDYVGFSFTSIAVLNNGNYVVKSSQWANGNADNAGAVTWCNGNTGTAGTVSSSNSLVGTQAGDQVGLGSITELTNGNYVVTSPLWAKGSSGNVGAVTWCSGISGASGVVSEANSLVGSTAGDQVGGLEATSLPNGNYVVTSLHWSNVSAKDAGAVTWGSGVIGIKGAVSSANSLVGSQKDDRVGYNLITVLSNGNYVVDSYYWSNGSAAQAGAVTWGNGTSGISGEISSANSLVGTKEYGLVGSAGVTGLSNGNYVVSSPYWANGNAVSAGAVTWGNGGSGINGVISNTNSLVGILAYSYVGKSGVKGLTNGNYVAFSPDWPNGNISSAGAVTWGDGLAGISGPVSISNSLVGSQANDHVGISSYRFAALSNGNYVVGSPDWENGSVPAAGAITWGNGSTGNSGVINNMNSLVGSQENDHVGSGTFTALKNGNYVVGSGGWANGSATSAGAVSWGNGASGTSGVVGISNSFLGSQTGDNVGASYIFGLANGNYVVESPDWANGGVSSAGAVTWGNGSSGTSGVVGITNSLVGSHINDQEGNFGFTLDNSNYVIVNNTWDNGIVTDAGGVTLGNGSGGTTGPVTSCNSVIGNIASSTTRVAYNTSFEKLIVGKPLENIVSIFAPSQSSLALVSTSANNTAGGDATIAFVDNNCQLIASLKPSGAVPVTGSIAANVYVESNVFTAADGKVYARRHYDISPVTDPNTATSGITLYFTQAEFDDYNANNGTAPDLPTGPTDEEGKIHVSIIQQHGTSPTGIPDTYSGWTGVGPAKLKIIPGASNVVWNTNLLRWEVTFDVTGFSGFFLRGDNNYPLAVQLVNFTAKAESSRNRLDWNNENETQGIIYEVERSADGSSFTKLDQVSGKGKNASYIFYDENPLNGNNYYRLKMIEPSGESDYSNVVLVKRNNISGGISVYPIPSDNILHINYSNRTLDGSTVTALDLQGRVMAKATLTTSTQMNIQKWPAGIYMLRFADGSVVKVVKK